MKIPNWKEIVPFEYYLSPLENEIKILRDQLLKMRKDGPLRIKYIIEDN
jgi:hypothetical protein